MKIGLIGTYDVDNFGDCAFPVVHQALLAQRITDASFTLYSPTSKTAQILGNEPLKALPDGPGVDILPEDAFILTGGETIHFGHSSGTYIFPAATNSSFLRLWLSPLQTALATGARFAAHCVGVRLADPQVHAIIGSILRSADLVTLRDRVSQERVSAGGSEFPLAVDPMFALRTIRSDEQWDALAHPYLPVAFDERGYIVAQVSPPYLEGNAAEWTQAVIDLAIAQNRNLLFLPICHFLDDAHVLAPAHQAAIAALGTHGLQSHIVPQPIHVLETAAILGKSAGYVGTSLHGAVTAVSFGLPLAVLTHDAKAKHQQVLAAIGIPDATAIHISEIGQAFRNSQAHDLQNISAEVSTRALMDFDHLVAVLTGPKAERPAITRSDLAAIRKADLSTIRSSKEKLKRHALSVAKRFPKAYGQYRKLKNKITA